MSPYLDLAKSAVEHFVKKGEFIVPPKSLPKELLKKKAGVFISIHKREKLRGLPFDEQKRILRGCIGSYLPAKKSLAEEIISSAVSASQDPRFLPIQKEELPYLIYEVYVLDKPEPVKDIRELDPKECGVLVKSASFKSGLLLPGLEGIRTPEEQIYIACQKAGINPLEEKIIIYKFKAEKYG
jgi:uncharacterized protein (TIGR00296 family)